MKTIRALVLFAFIFSTTAGITRQGMAADALSATQTLKSSIDAILDVLNAPGFKAGDDKAGATHKICDIVNNRFDFGRIAQLSLGKHWRGRTPDEKHAFTVRFQHLIENTYISKIETYTNEKVVYLDEQVETIRGRDYAKVQTQIITTDGTQIPIDYRMYRQGSEPWMVFDINIEGVSMVNNYRSQFDEFLGQNSFAQLLEDLDAKRSSE